MGLLAHIGRIIDDFKVLVKIFEEVADVQILAQLVALLNLVVTVKHDWLTTAQRV